MKSILKEYGASLLSIGSGLVLLSLLASIFWSEGGLLMELIALWGKGGC